MRGILITGSNLRNTLLDTRSGQGVEIQLQLLVLPAARKLLEHQTRLNVPAVLVLARTALADLTDDFLVSDLANFNAWIDPNRLNRVELDGPMTTVAYASKARRTVNEQS